MGHVRLGEIPRSHKWDQVVGLIAGGAQARQVANATIRAAERILERAYHDRGLIEVVWLLLHLPLAARKSTYPASLRELGLDVSEAPLLVEILAAFTDTVDGSLFNNKGRTDLGEMAQMAAVETLAGVLIPRTEDLFGRTAEAVQQQLGKLATTQQVSHLGRCFFARLIYKSMDFYLTNTAMARAVLATACRSFQRSPASDLRGFLPTDGQPSPQASPLQISDVISRQCVGTVLKHYAWVG